MARPSQFECSSDDAPAEISAVKTTAKRLGESDRAYLIAWLCMYYTDTGTMFSPQITRRRQRIVLDGIEYWLVRVPKRP